MKPEKIICIGTVVGVILGLIAVILLMLGVIKYFTDTEKSLTYFVCGAIATLPVSVLDIVVMRAKEKINPLRIDKQKVALEYVVCSTHGKKADFIQEYGEIMYNHFVEKGYIHPLACYNGDTWEITALGQTTMKKIKS